MADSYYPSQLRALADLIEKVDKLDESIFGPEGGPAGEPAVWISRMEIKYEGDDFGMLVDEIGGAWSWVPPGTTEDE